MAGTTTLHLSELLADIWDLTVMVEVNVVRRAAQMAIRARSEDDQPEFPVSPPGCRKSIWPDTTPCDLFTPITQNDINAAKRIRDQRWADGWAEIEKIASGEAGIELAWGELGFAVARTRVVYAEEPPRYGNLLSASELIPLMTHYLAARVEVEPWSIPSLWVFVVDSIVRESVVVGIGSALLAAFASQYSLHGAFQSSPLSAEIARMHGAGLTERLIDGIRGTYPKVADMLGLSEEPGELHQAKPPSETTEVAATQSVQQSPSVANLKSWKLGTEDGKTWWLFRRTSKGRIEPSRIDLPGGIPLKLAERLADGGGKLSRSDAMTIWDRSDNRRLRKSTDAKGKLRKAIKHRIRDAGNYGTVPDPIPWKNDGWIADLEFGYAIKNDEGRLVFKTKTALSIDDAIDAVA